MDADLQPWVEQSTQQGMVHLFDDLCSCLPCIMFRDHGRQSVHI